MTIQYADDLVEELKTVGHSAPYISGYLAYVYPPYPNPYGIDSWQRDEFQRGFADASESDADATAPLAVVV